MSLYIGNTKISQCGVVFTDGDTSQITEQNLKKNVTALGVHGTFTSSDTVSAGQTAATSDDILTGKSAWVDGSEIKGGMIVNRYFVGTEAPASNLGIDGDIYLQITEND